MKLKSGTLVFIIICVFFAGICLFNIIEGNENMKIEEDTPCSDDENMEIEEDTPCSDNDSVEQVFTNDKMKLFNGRIFYSIPKTNDNCIVASVDSNVLKVYC